MSRASSLLRVLETALAAAGGAALAGSLGLLGGVPAAVALGGAAGLNGALGGWHRTYAWRTARGWLAFAVDSTWGLVGTTLGALLCLVDLALPGATHRAELSRRRNRHWFTGGLRLRRGFILTLGNVVSGAPTGLPGDPRRLAVVERHEDVHILQNRAFGPLYPVAYSAWFALGALVGLIVWAARRGRPRLSRLVETAAYYDNPFEYWAYRSTGHWEDNRADPTLKWRRPVSAERKAAP